MQEGRASLALKRAELKSLSDSLQREHEEFAIQKSLEYLKERSDFFTPENIGGFSCITATRLENRGYLEATEYFVFFSKDPDAWRLICSRKKEGPTLIIQTRIGFEDVPRVFRVKSRNDVPDVIIPGVLQNGNDLFLKLAEFWAHLEVFLFLYSDIMTQCPDDRKSCPGSEFFAMLLRELK